MENEDILNRWSEYITELYHDDRGPLPIINNEEGPRILEEDDEKRQGRRTGTKYHPKC